MRIAGFSIRNYKGIRHAEASGLESESVVVISGRNGTGKTLLLECLATMWHNSYDPIGQIGPWGDAWEAQMTLQLATEEVAAVNSWAASRGVSQIPPGAESVSFGCRISTRTGYQTYGAVHIFQIFQDGNFQLENSFARIDYLPAVRMLPSSPSPSANLSLMRKENIEQERRNLSNQALQRQPMVSLPDISTYLATLDYQNYLAHRQGLPLEDAYARISEAFMEATGKRIELPEFDPTTTQSGINVVASPQSRHPIDKLSSGEKGLLGLMFYVRRISSSGGVLLLDEPELHLHPSLQGALFESMRGLADRAQVITVSHSANLIATAPISGMIQIEPPAGTAVNQVTRLSEAEEKIKLMSILGISPATVLQSDGILVLEGESDSTYLSELFPVEMGRFRVIVAGNSKEVLAAHRTLEEFSIGLPWLALCDRDLATEVEVSRLTNDYRNLFVWDRREIESYLLDESLIHAAMNVIGQRMDRTAVRAAIRTVVDKLKEDVLLNLVEKRVADLHPAPTGAYQGNRFEKMRRQLNAYAEMNSKRANAVLDAERNERVALEARWENEWMNLVDPKAALAALNVELRAFHTPDDFKRALLARARDDAAVRPAGLESFRRKLSEMLSHS